MRDARPLARRADTIARPARVRIRRRKPCTRARRRLFGWNVRLPLATVKLLDTSTPAPGRRWCADGREFGELEFGWPPARPPSRIRIPHMCAAGDRSRVLTPGNRVKPPVDHGASDGREPRIGRTKPRGSNRSARSSCWAPSGVLISPPGGGRFAPGRGEPSPAARDRSPRRGRDPRRARGLDDTRCQRYRCWSGPWRRVSGRPPAGRLHTPPTATGLHPCRSSTAVDNYVETLVGWHIRGCRRRLERSSCHFGRG